MSGVKSACKSSQNQAKPFVSEESIQNRKRLGLGSLSSPLQVGVWMCMDKMDMNETYPNRPACRNPCITQAQAESMGSER